MDDEHTAAQDLGGLALGNILRDLGIDQQHEGGLERFGISSRSSKLQTEQIYNDNFQEDQNDLGVGNSASSTRDWEAEVDNEMRKELANERDSEERAALDRYYRQGMAQLERPSKRLRGEDDDFDDEADNDNEDQKGTLPRLPNPPPPPPSSSYQQPTSSPFDPSIIKIKTERDEDNELSLLSQPLPPSTQLILPVGRSPSPQSPPPSHLPPSRPMVDMQEIRTLFPDFEPGKILNFTQLFASHLPKKKKMFAKPASFRLQPDVQLVLPRSSREALLQPESKKQKHVSILQKLVQDLAGDERSSDTFGQDQDDDQNREIDLLSTAGVRAGTKLSKLAMMELDDWEERIAWSEQDVHSMMNHLYDLQLSAGMNPIQPTNIDGPFNHDLSNGSWTKSIIWHQNSRFQPFDQLVLDMNDPQMMLEDDTDLRVKHNSLIRSDAPVQSDSQRAASSRGAVAAGSDPFNLSNDKFYEQNREHRQRVRQTLGKLVVQHAWPATKLQLPWYKTKLTKAEARSFHRPAIQFPTNMPLHFSKTRSNKKKKESAKKAKDPNEMLRTTRDLTLKDTGPFVLYEYSEEYPPLISKLGMGSLLVNYYRKKDGKDEHIPKMDIGEPYVLDVADESPFMKFGNIDPGQVQPTLYNNLLRAPLFRHKPAHTDFLLIRSTTKDQVRYYLREIRNLYVVGQTYPVQPIPGPHARLITNNIKYRLQMIAYKLIQKTLRQRIKIHRLMRYFPDQNELQMRQRLKEFMEYNRKAGDINQGFWKLKSHIVVPEESELFKLLPPENICLAESMQVGQRHLLDAGYTNTAEGNDEDGDESKMDVEQLLAPWITSKNFINATQGKAMLKLHGDGDPSGRGEAFSFIRVSMKEIFLRADEDVEERLAQAEAEAKSKSGHKYSVAEQQAVYRSEIDRIWNAQCRSLSNPIPPQLTPEEEKGPLFSGGKPGHSRRQSRTDLMRRDRSPSAASTPGLGSGDATDKESTKILRIRRLINGKWHKEIVRDPAVINAYMMQRKKIEDESIATEDLVPTGDSAVDASRMKRLQEELAQRKKNQERRIQRKNAKAAAEGLEIPGGYKKLLNKTDTKRRCGRCGEVGHMSTNTSCTLYPKDGGKNGAGGAAGGPGGPGTPTAVRPGMPSLAGGAGFFGPGVGIGMGVGIGPATPGAMTPISVASSSATPQTPGSNSGGGGGGIKLKLKKKS